MSFRLNHPISTHAPHAGSDVFDIDAAQIVGVFQLTLPMRGAIFTGIHAMVDVIISTHAPHAGSDFSEDISTQILREFQLTLPMRGAISICFE